MCLTIERPKSQSGAAIAQGPRVRLGEALENARQEFAFDTHPGVSDADLHPTVKDGNRDLNSAVVGRELDRVVEQVRHALLQALRIALDGHRSIAGIGDQRDPLGVRARPHQLDRRLNDRDEIDRRRRDLELAAGDARRIDQLVHHVGHALGGPIDTFDGRGDPLGRLRAAAQKRSRQHDRIERCAQLVRGHRKKSVLRIARLFGGFLRQPQLRPRLLQRRDDRDHGNRR